ncbi:MAG: hypothetical protein F6J87_14235 [Spirulina sp. SIO3F2]|nr:hypothetical protein [Spirulina sp. SIO3F2]
MISTLSKVRAAFELTIQEPEDLFADIASLAPEESLAITLQENLPLATASNTEKARSELLITPILLAIRRRYGLGFFSGVDFTVDSDQGLNGFCDYILTAAKDLYEIRSPVVALVEAKNENIKAGLGQCLAEMVAAQLFNQRSGDADLTIYGCVKTGTTWKFLKLDGQACQIDLRDYFIVELAKILGILVILFSTYQ